MELSRYTSCVFVEKYVKYRFIRLQGIGYKNQSTKNKITSGGENRPTIRIDIENRHETIDQVEKFRYTENSIAEGNESTKK